MEIAYNQILLLLLQCLIIAILLMSFFRLRSIFGLGLLYIALGVFQFLQVFLASSFVVEVASGIFISSGSMVLFSASLFMVLIIYIREDALETRKIIYALLAANLITALLLVVFGWSIDSDFITSLYNLPREFFSNNARILLVGTLIFILDAFAIIFIYEFISKYVKPLFLRILITMTLVLSLDSILFALGIFYGKLEFQNLLISSLIAKNLAAVIYSSLFTLYLVYFDTRSIKNDSEADTFKDIFHKLTFRQKYEDVFTEMKNKSIELEQAQKIAQLGTVNLDLTTMLFTSSPIFDTIFGFNLEKIKKFTTYQKTVHPDDLSENKKILANCIKTGEIFDREYRIFTRKTKKLKWIHGMGEVIYKEGKPIFFKGTVQDISDRKTIELQLLKSENKFRELYEKSGDAILIQKNDIFIECNQAAVNLFGYKTNETILKSDPSKLSPIFQPDGQKSSKKSIDVMNEALKKGSHKFEWTHINKKGEEFPVEVLLTSISNDPNNKILHSVVRDISDRKEAEDSVRKSTQLLETSQRIAQLGGWELDIATNNLFWTAETYRIHDTSPEEFNPTVDASVSHFLPESKRIISEALEVALKKGEGYDLELETLTTKGRLISVRTTCVVSLYEGRPVKLSGIFQDITDRKQAEVSLQASEDRFQRFANSSFEGIGIHVDGIIQDVNNHLSEMSGYSKKELIGKPYMTIVHPDDLKMVADYIKKGYEEALEFRILKKDGNVVYVEGRGAHISYNGKNARISNFYDISDRIQIKKQLIISEEKFSKAYFNNPFPIFMSSIPDGKIIDINSKFEKVTGRSRKELIGNNVMDLGFYANEQDRLKLFKELENKGRLQGYEIEFKGKGGKIRDCHMFSEIIDLDGKPCLVSIVSDITDQKQSKLALENQNKKLTTLSTEISKKHNLIIESERKFKNLFDKNPISLWEEDLSKVKQLLDKKLTETSDLEKYLNENPDFVFECISKVEILNVNNITLELFGVNTTEELINHLNKSFNDNSIATFKNELLALASNKKEFSEETEFIRTDGEIITALINFMILDDDYEKAIISIVDITQLNRAKEKIVESERKFKNLFDKNPVSLWEEDFSVVKQMLNKKLKETSDLKQYLDENPDFVAECISNLEIFNVNDITLELLGYKNKKELFAFLGETFNERSIEGFKKQLVAVSQNKKEFSTESELVRSDGMIIDVLINFVSTNNNEDDDDGLSIVSIVDITELNKAKEKIVESEKRFRELYEKSGDAILIIKNGIFTECNQATVDMLKYKSKEAFLNSHPSKLSPILQPDGKKSFEKSVEMMDESLKKGTHRFEWIHTKQNGVEFPVEVVLTAITNEPNNQIIHCVWRDITSRKQAEQSLVESERELQNSQEIAQLGTFNVDLTTQLLTSSPIFDAIAGFDPGKIKKFATFQATVHPEDLDEKEKMLQNCIKTGKRFDIEYRIFTKNTKELKWIHAMGEVIYIESAPAFFKGTIQDITTRKLIDLKVKINEQKLIEIQKIANLGTYEIDLTTNVITTSELYNSIFGIKEKPTNNKGWWKSVTHPEDFESSEQLWQQCIKDCTFYNDEYRILTNKNEIKWIHDIAEVKCDNGIAVKIVGTVQDITNLKLTERKIKRSDAILSQINSLVKVTDKNGSLTYASQSFKTILGYEPDEMLGQGWWIKTTDNIKLANKTRDEVLDVVNNEKSLNNKLRNRWIKAKDGQPKLFQWTCSKGLGDSLIFIGIDVTEKEIAEKNSAQYWEIVENSLNEIFIFDADTLLFIEVNRGARQNIGYTSKELLKMTPVDIKPLITKREFNQLLKPLKNNTQEKVIFTSEHQRKDGTTYKAEVNIQKSELELKPVFIASIKDVTQQKKNEQVKQIIFNITKKSNESISLEDLFKFIKIELGKLINTTNFFVALYDEKTEMISTPYIIDEFDRGGDFPKGETLTGYVIDTKKALLTKDSIVKNLSNNQKVICLGPEAKCWLGVPILIDNQAIGAIVVQSYTDENAYNEGDAILLELIASNIGQIIRKAEDLEQIKLLNQALIHTPAIVMITNKNVELEFINSSFTKELGYEFDEVIGKNPKFLNTEIKIKEFYSAVGKSIATNGYWKDEIINFKKNGDSIRVSASIAPVKDKNQNVSHYIIVEEDITEKRKLERQFINAIIEAQDIEKQSFGEELHDSISQILSAESMYIDLLVDQNQDRIEGKAKFLTKIKELNSSAINETRNIAHGLMSNQLKQSGLLISVENICIDFSNKKNIEFKFVNDGVDEKELSQEIKTNLFRIIQELSTNINRYSNATKATIHFSKLKQNILKLIVKDNGIGMDYNKIKNGATGTGLQTVKRRITYLDGDFDLESTMNQGTCYTLKIPL